MITQADSSSRIKMESGNQMFWPGNMIFCRNWGQTGAKQLRKWEYARSRPKVATYMRKVETNWTELTQVESANAPLPRLPYYILLVQARVGPWAKEKDHRGELVSLQAKNSRPQHSLSQIILNKTCTKGWLLSW